MSKQTFTQKVLSIVSKIPKGKVLTYKEVAEKAGNKKAARAVGTIMSKNYDLKVPCHRVILPNGKVGDYNRGGGKKKREILIKEGAIKQKDQG
jgi:O-6-methylguanine DNA methyltransferase